MPLVDAHVHLYPPAVGADPAAWAARQGEAHWSRLCTRVRRDGRPVQAFPTVDELLRTLDAAGVDRAWLLGWYWEQAATCALHNRFIAACVRAHPDRFSGFASVQPRAGEAVVAAELRRARDEGLVGVGELSPHSQGCPPDEPGLAAVLAQAGQWGWPVNLHVTDPDSRPYPGRVETPMADLLGWARAHPGTRFILAHWGGLWPLRDAAARALPNVWYDTAASPLLYDASVWRRFTAAVPSSRVLFGSDHPLVLYPRIAAGAEIGGLVAEARAAGQGADVLGGNAVGLLAG